MSIESIVDKMLDHPAVRAVVGTRWALGELDAGQYPAITYRMITNVDQQNLASYKTAQKQQARVQVNLHAQKQTDLIRMREAVRAALHNKYSLVVANHRVVSSVAAFAGQPDRDDTLGVWTQPLDFLVRYY